MVENRIVRSIPCKDASARTREFQIIAVPGRFTLVAPPGGSANFEPRQYEAVHSALLEVLTVAWQQPDQQTP